VPHDTHFAGSWKDLKYTSGARRAWSGAFIADLAESGEASDETIRDMAGHVSKQMLKHYSHIRKEAKRALVRKPEPKEEPPVSIEAAKVLAKVQ
jgi:hypothetical protein